ncbi:hypothetical protein OIV83_003548 [Microbotryomycetes sp. JL201]|nr:hypothetical protein OIV83_003548 [Microbotryomycetes sp. JL201]
MSSFPDGLVDELSQLSGVPHDDVKSQVLPYMTSELDDLASVKLHLETFLQPGRQSRAFIDKFGSWWQARRANKGSTSSAARAQVRGDGSNARPARPSTSSSYATSPLEPTTNPLPSPTPQPKHVSSSTAALVLDLDSAASQELLLVDRALRQFQRGSKASKRSCFCQANVSAHVAALESRRQHIIDTEQRRLEAERRQAELETAAIKFPGLRDAQLVAQARAGTTVARGYADHASGSSVGNLQRRVEKAYETGVSVNGKPFGRSGGGPADNGAKVLRLDPKTKKVKVETRTVKKSERERPAATIENNVEEDGLESWVDELDDGLAGARTASRATDLVDDRPFLNLDWSVAWVPRTEPSTIDHEEARKPAPALAPARASVAQSRSSVPAANVSSTAKAAARSDGRKGKSKNKKG